MIFNQFYPDTHRKHKMRAGARARGRARKAVVSQYCGGEYGGEY